ncbi:MAG: DNA polymerase III subunit gamma/tau [Candidatus Limnocylindria bacterium]
MTSPRRALYRSWRAQRFSELIGQEPIVTTLRNAVAGDRLSHAYLFVGPRGTGKTSTARLLAKAINCTARDDSGEPCDRCASCVAIREGRAMDVIEIDAASHGLVEDARDLVMRALTAPTELRKRVYIVDEVHMLSPHAFNALLKLIEEPPDHVVFVLATTDTHKVPPTMISRTQRFDFRRLPVDLMVTKLERICAAEGASAEPDALRLLATLADGAMRDAEGLLDQVLSYADGTLTAATVREVVGLAADAEVAALVDALITGEAGAALDVIERLADAGRDMAQLASQASDEARRRLLRSAANPALARRLAAIVRSLAEAAGSAAREGKARLVLEILSVECGEPGAPAAVAPDSVSSVPGPSKAAPAPEQRSQPSADTSARDQHDAQPAPASAFERRRAQRSTPSRPPSASPEPVAVADGATADGVTSAQRPPLAVVRGRWAEVVALATPVIKPLLLECRPVALDGARLTLAFPEGREFMRARITARAESIEQLLGGLFGGVWALECVATSVELEPLSVAEAVGADAGDPAGQALLDGVLRITGGELVNVPDVR